MAAGIDWSPALGGSAPGVPAPWSMDRHTGSGGLIGWSMWRRRFADASSAPGYRSLRPVPHPLSEPARPRPRLAPGLVGTVGAAARESSRRCPQAAEISLRMESSPTRSSPSPPNPDPSSSSLPRRARFTCSRPPSAARLLGGLGPGGRPHRPLPETSPTAPRSSPTGPAGRFTGAGGRTGTARAPGGRQRHWRSTRGRLSGPGRSAPRRG